MMTDKPKIELEPNVHRDIALTNLLVRMTALETLLKEKGLLQDEEYTIILNKLLQEMENKLKIAGIETQRQTNG